MWKPLAARGRRNPDVVTIGAQGVIVDDQSRVLLVRHGYRPGWHFPGGGVERGEEIEDALHREVREETGVTILEPPRLFGIYANFQSFPGDHVVVFVINSWRQDAVPKPNTEIAEQRFFARNNLPDTLVAGAQRRILEIFDGAARSEHW